MADDQVDTLAGEVGDDRFALGGVGHLLAQLVGDEAFLLKLCEGVGEGLVEGAVVRVARGESADGDDVGRGVFGCRGLGRARASGENDRGGRGCRDERE